VKTSLTILALQLIWVPAMAQYQGGPGQGNKSLTATALPLSASTMYSGGSNDGNVQVLGTALNLGTNTPYSGGSGDGNSLQTVTSLSLASNSSYSGGADDGAATGLASALSLSMPNMYSGGLDDGSATAASTALSLSGSGSYSGGPDDGASSLLVSSMSLAVNSMYAGGSNDGSTSILSSSLPLISITGIYSGGPDDGFSSILDPAAPLVVLPVSWENFNVARITSDALLDWTVSHEYMDLGFDIERSFDGNEFHKIGFVEAIQIFSATHTYNYTDPDPAHQCTTGNCRQVFYRLKQLDQSGRYSYSPIKTLSLDAASLVASVYPNPASGKLIVKINNTGNVIPVYQISIYNNLGMSVLQIPLQNQLKYEVDIRELPSGMYYLKLAIDGHTYPYQITIEH